MHGPFPQDSNLLAQCPTLHAFAERIAAERDLKVEVRNFRRIVLTDMSPRERYSRRDRVVIKIADGEMKCQPDNVKPTDQEAAAIKLEIAALTFPASVPATEALSKQQRAVLGVSEDCWFEIRGANRDDISMCQQRVDHEDGTKDYLPWSYWNDGKWRMMEPDGDGLPLWKPKKNRLRPYLMIHEGAKAARYVDRLVNDDDPAIREVRSKHPWSTDLAFYEHWGWIGGAPNPHRTDWSEVSRYANLKEVVVVTDHDIEGMQAIAPIARALKSLRVPVWEVRFSDAFPEAYDMAKSMPEKFWVRQRYRGPSLTDLRRSATWATRQLTPNVGKGQATYAARQAFLRQWIVATKPAVFVHRDDPEKLLTDEEFNSNMRQFSDVKDTADILRREPAVRVDSIAYEPGENKGTVTVDGRLMFNTWTPTRIGRVKGDVGPFLQFMTHLIPDAKELTVVFRWMTTLVARPGVKMKYGILMISEEQGVGKGTLMEKILAPLVGWHNVSIPNEKQLVDSKYNAYLVSRRLVLVHEIYAGQSKKAYDSVKSDVSEEYIDVEIKYLTPFRIRNCAHFMLSSNSFFALRLVKNDRRWFIPKITETKRTDQYWLDLNTWLVDGGLEAIHEWCHDYAGKHKTVGAGDEAPLSAMKERLIRSSRSDGQQIVFDLGEAAVKMDKPMMLTDRKVRDWLKAVKETRLNDPKLESLGTIRAELRGAGMIEAFESKDSGMRFVAFANQKAIEDLQRKPQSEWTWSNVKDLVTTSINHLITQEQGQERAGQSQPEDQERPQPGPGPDEGYM